MSESKRDTRFWVQLVLFQVIFAMAVFYATRAYYLDAGKPARATTAARSAAPHPLPPAGDADDLAKLIANVPGTLANDPAALARQGDAYFAQGQFPQAAQSYDRALRAGDTDVNTWNSLGLTLHYLGRSEEALSLLEEGVERDPDYQRIWLTLGYVSSQAGNLDRAREALGTAREMNPDNDIGQSAAEMLESLR